MDSEYKGVIGIISTVAICLTLFVNVTMITWRKVHRNADDVVKIILAESAERTGRLSECTKLGGTWHDEFDGWCEEKDK